MTEEQEQRIIDKIDDSIDYANQVAVIIAMLVGACSIVILIAIFLQ